MVAGFNLSLDYRTRVRVERRSTFKLKLICIYFMSTALESGEPTMPILNVISNSNTNTTTTNESFNPIVRITVAVSPS